MVSKKVLNKRNWLSTLISAIGLVIAFSWPSNVYAFGKADLIELKDEVVSEFKLIPWGAYAETAKEELYLYGATTKQFVVQTSHDISSNLLKVKIDEISGLSRLNRERILNSLAVDEQPWVWTFLFGEVQQRLKKDPWVRDSRVSWSVFPLRLSLEIEEQDPWLVAEYNDESWLVGRGGSVIEALRELERSDVIVEFSSLPRLDGIDQKQNLQTSLVGSNTRFRQAVTLLQEIEYSGGFPYQVERFTLLDEGGFRVSPVKVDEYPDVLLAPQNDQDIKQVVHELNVVLNDIKQRAEKPKLVDLRYSNRAIIQF